jgi:hypothetical protein
MLDWFANNLMQANPDKFEALTANMPCYRTIIEVG